MPSKRFSFHWKKESERFGETADKCEIENFGI